MKKRNRLLNEDEQEDAVLAHPEMVAAMEKAREKSRKIRRRVAGGGSSTSSGEKGSFIYVDTVDGRGYVLGALTGKDITQPSALVVIARDEWNAKHPTNQIIGPCVHKGYKVAELPEWEAHLKEKSAEFDAMEKRRTAKAEMKAEMKSRGIDAQ